jgi:pyridoxal phosphate enzyme (YggS family)
MSDTIVRETLKGRLAVLEQQILSACVRSGRRRDEVTLVCVTKTVTPTIAALLPDLGYHDLGESRPQELWRKAAAIATGVTWHLIGHLQRNKIDQTLPLAHWIHSADRWSLLEALEKEGVRRDQPARVLLEVNASRETNKHGFKLEELPAVADKLGTLRFVEIKGLMTMAAVAEDPRECRPTFAALREARDQLRGALKSPHTLEHLSMGMTNDFEIAIEEGATMIRVGTAIFAGLADNAR